MPLLKLACLFTVAVAAYSPFPNVTPINFSKQESNTPVQQKSQPDPTPHVKEEHPKENATSRSDVQILSDTMGVDFGPYLQHLVHDVREKWYALVPGSARAPMKKSGEVMIEFAIRKDGKIAGLRLQKSSGDVALDRSAWGAITESNPLPLPSEFSGQFLRLRFNFQYNPDNKPAQAAQPK